MTWTKLGQAKLEGADLSVDMNNADLTGTNLKNADLSGVKLDNTNLVNAIRLCLNNPICLIKSHSTYFFQAKHYTQLNI